jgi:hypothetical protein
MSRVDLFTVIHKGIRALLFDLAREAARVDPTSAHAIDGLVALVERTLEFLDEHARIEDAHVVGRVRALDVALAQALAAEHRALEVLQLEVERAADALALAELSARADAAAQLTRTINRLVAAQLTHMNREETEIMSCLWAGLPDDELVAIRARSREMLTPERHAEWMRVVAPALNPVEHALVIGPTVG